MAEEPADGARLEFVAVKSSALLAAESVRSGLLATPPLERQVRQIEGVHLVGHDDTAFFHVQLVTTAVNADLAAIDQQRHARIDLQVRRELVRALREKNDRCSIQLGQNIVQARCIRAVGAAADVLRRVAAVCSHFAFLFPVMPVDHGLCSKPTARPNGHTHSSTTCLRTCWHGVQPTRTPRGTPAMDILRKHFLRKIE